MTTARSCRRGDQALVDALRVALGITPLYSRSRRVEPSYARAFGSQQLAALHAGDAHPSIARSFGTGGEGRV